MSYSNEGPASNRPTATAALTAGISDFSNRLAEMSQEVWRFEQRVCDVCNALYGPRPEEVGKEPAPAGDNIDGRLHNLQIAINALGRRLSALEGGNRN